jgi:hypothetical protein
VRGAVPHVGAAAAAGDVAADPVATLVGDGFALSELSVRDEPGPLQAATASRPPAARIATAWWRRALGRTAVWRNILLPPWLLVLPALKASQPGRPNETQRRQSLLTSTRARVTPQAPRPMSNTGSR